MLLVLPAVEAAADAVGYFNTFAASDEGNVVMEQMLSELAAEGVSGGSSAVVPVHIAALGTFSLFRPLAEELVFRGFLLPSLTR